MTQPHQDGVEWLRRSVQSLTEELLRVYEELILLYSLGRQIGPLADEGQIAAVALQEAMDVLSANCGWVALLDGERFQIPDGCRIGIEAGTVSHISRAVLEPLSRGGKSEFLSHSLKEECRLSEADVPARFVASSLAVGRNSRGYMCLGRHQTGSIFLSADQKLISAVASVTAVELENVRLQRSELEKQRLVNELELARNIQRSLLPHDFSFADFFDAAGISEPCYEIGGDYFDLIPMGSDLALLVIADVMGKGPPAARRATMVQGIVHGVSRYCLEPSSLMVTLNECILKRAVEGNCVTAFLATLDRTGHLRYTNGGHNPPLWIQTDGRVTELCDGGLLVGFQESAAYLQGSIQLQPGDLLLLYTDGVTDTEDQEGTTFGSARLLEWACQQAGRSPLEVEESLIHRLSQFCRGTRQADDLTVLVVQYSGSRRVRVNTN